MDKADNYIIGPSVYEKGKKEINDLRDNNKQLLKEISQYKEENEKLKRENEKLKAESFVLSHNIDDYRLENEKLRRENEEILKEISQYKEELVKKLDSNTIIKELKQKNNQANKALENISYAVDNAYEHREHRNHEENIKSVKCFVDYIKEDFDEFEQTQLYVFAAETETERHCKAFEDIKELNKDEENYKEYPRTIAKINVSLIDVVNKFIEFEKNNEKYPYIIRDMFQLFTTDNDFTPLEITKMIIEEFLNKYEYHHDL